MEYILLGRTLDTVAREAGYLYTPDQILKEIVEYAGNVKLKPSHVYEMVIYYKYDSYRQLLNQENAEINVANTILDNEGVVHKLIKKNVKGSLQYSYCACCNHFYGSPNTHIESKKHKTNSLQPEPSNSVVRKAIRAEMRERFATRYSWTMHKNIRVVRYTVRDRAFYCGEFN